jgi:hypothetical protein
MIVVPNPPVSRHRAGRIISRIRIEMTEYDKVNGRIQRPRH